MNTTIAPNACTCAAFFAEHLADLKGKAERYPKFSGSYLQARNELLNIRNRHVDRCASCLAAEEAAA